MLLARHQQSIIGHSPKKAGSGLKTLFTSDIFFSKGFPSSEKATPIYQ
jgi:hypothetical protein